MAELDTLDRLPKFSSPDEEEAFLSWYSGMMKENGWPRHPKDAPEDPRAAFLAAQEDDDLPEEQYSSPAGTPPRLASATEQPTTEQPTAQPVSLKGEAPASRTGTSLQEWLPAAQKANPGVEPKELKQYWNQKYGHIDPATLPTWEEFKPKAQAANPDVPEDDLEEYWQDKYGDLGAALKRPPEPSAFMRGMETGVKQLPMLGHGIEAGIGAVGEKIFGEGGVSTAIKQHGIKGYQEASESIEKTSRPSDSATTAYEMAKDGNPGALFEFLKFGIGYAVTQGLEMVATGGMGYAVGKLGLQGAAKLVGEKLIAKEAARLAETQGAKLTGEALTKQATANVAGRIGQTTALAATATGMEGGEIYGDLVTQAQQDGRELSGGDLAKAFGFTLGAGALEFVGDKLGFDLLAGKSKIGKLAGEATGLTGRAARGAIQGTVGAGVEAGTELGQTFLEQAGKGQEIGTPDSIREAVDSAALGAVGGGTVGGLSGLSSKAQKPIKTVQIPKALGVGDPNVSVNEAIQEAAKILADTETEADLAQANAEANDLKQRAQAEMATLLAPERTRTPSDIPILEGPEAQQPTFPSVLNYPKPTDAATAKAAEMVKGTAPLPAEPSPIVPGSAYTPRQDEQPIPDQVVSPRTRQAEGEPAIIQPESRPAYTGIYPTGAPVPSEEAKAAAATSIKGIEGTYKTGQSTESPQTGIEAERARLQAMQAKQQEQAPVDRPLPEYLKENIEQEYANAQRLGVVDKIKDMAADGKIAKDIAKALNVDMLLVRAVRAKEGIPAADQEGFAQWAEKHKAERQSPGIPAKSGTSLSPQAIHTLAKSKGMDPESAVFKEYTKLITGKAHLDDLTPAQLQQVADKLNRLKTTKPEQATNPITDATVPRSDLPPRQNAELLARAEKAKAELESGTAEPGASLVDFLRKRGGVQDQGGELSTMEIDRQKKAFTKNLIQANGLTLDDAAEAAHEAGLIDSRDINALLAALDKEARGGSGADWYREATTGPQKLSKERVDAAVAKIIADEGRDTGKDVERIKGLLLQDGDFQASPFAPKSEEDWKALVEAATGKDEAVATVQPDGIQNSDGTWAEHPKDLNDKLKSELETLGEEYRERFITTQRLSPEQARANTARLNAVEARMKEIRRQLAAGEEPKSQIEQERDKLEAMKGEAKETDFAYLRELYDAGLAGKSSYRSRSVMTPDENEAYDAGLAGKMFPPKFKAPVEEKAGQQEIAVPPPTVGERPIIGREPQPGEAPLFSPSAQLPDVEQTELPETDPKVDATWKVASFVERSLEQKTAPGVLAFSLTELTKRADEDFGGTQAQGTYTPKDLFDAIELGVNRFIQNVGQLGINPNANAAETVAWIRERILDKIPAQQNRRTAEQDEFQQFSTPPDLAFVMNWVAKLQGTAAPGSLRDTAPDTVLEPSAGLGGLASFANNVTGTTVIVNEYSDRRAALLKTLGFTKVFTENAEQINNVLPEDIKPTVVIMNPPFSSTAGRMQGQRKSANVIAHLEQALKRLEPGGRLVALIGRGKADFGGETSKAVEEWLKLMAMKYAFRARIGLSGEGYKKYGTTFDNQLLIFDKVEASNVKTLRADVADVLDAIPLLKEVRNARTYQPTADQSRSEAVARPGESATGSELPVSPATGGVGPGTKEGSGVAGTQKRPQVGVRGSTESAGSKSDGVSATKPGQRSGGEQPVSGASVEPADAGGRGVAGDTGPRSRPDGSREQLPPDKNITVEQEKPAPILETELSEDGIYEVYHPQKLKIAGAQPHPGELVQSAAMAAVEPPDVTYTPKLPTSLVQSGAASIAQLEPVVAAGQSHEQILPNGTRRGYFIGDGTGVGKGREISTIILDNFNQGRKKAVWFSKKAGLVTDARRDWSGIDQDPTQIFDLKGIKVADALTKPEGILFTSYNTLISGLKADRGGNLIAAKDKKTDKTKAARLDQIVNWLGKDFDGVIAFDESHAMANAVATQGKRGPKDASSTGLVGLEIQRRLPKARIVYVSATGATEVANLAYAERLGLWGEGTAFPERTSFIGEMVSGGLAAMELVAQNMKAMGLYLARQLSFRGVTYDRMEHKLTPSQVEIYDEMARAWQLVWHNIQAALEETGANKNGKAKGAAKGKFVSSIQRFFNQILTSMQMPSVIADIRKQMEQGNAVLLQLVNTNEASQTREIERHAEEGDDLEDVDLTPRELLMSYVEKAFPTQQYEEYLDDNGKVQTRPVVDKQGRPVQNKEAVAMRDALLAKLGSLKVPDGPLEYILDTFGEKQVAEVTGRQERLLRVTDADGNTRRVHQKGRTEKVRLSDAKQFQDDKKRILIFSDAGGTGMSYHADLSAKNQRKRIHYLIQPGWRADNAVQGFGRSHRSNQKQPPHYVLVTTDLKGQKRFVTSVARRLDQLGALTKGQRQTGTQGFFSEEDNLEGLYANAAVKSLLRDLYAGRVPGKGWDDLVVGKMAFDNIVDKNDGKLIEERLPDTPSFLNRILTLESGEQNEVFDLFNTRMRRMIEMAAAKGELDTGLENFKADGLTIKSEQTVYTHPGSKAETKLIDFEARHKVEFVPFDDAKKMGKSVGFYKSEKTGKVFVAIKTGQTHTTEEGEVREDIVLRSPIYGKTSYITTVTLENSYEKLTTEQARTQWEKTIDDTPPYSTETVHVLTGLMLPIWDRLPKGFVRVLRMTTDDGQRFIGRRIQPDAITATRKKLGAEAGAESFTAASALERLDEKGRGGKIVLANGWNIKPVFVAGEDRYELKGDDLYGAKEELEKAGVFMERIRFDTRWFIPTDSAETVLTNLTKYRPITEVVGPGREEGLASNQRTGLSNNQTADPFYSQLERTIEAKMPARASFEQIKGILANSGVKADELKWTGLDDYLKTKDYFTKQDVLEFLKENNVQVQEVMKGDVNPKANAEVERLKQIMADAGFPMEVNEDDPTQVAFVNTNDPEDPGDFLSADDFANSPDIAERDLAPVARNLERVHANGLASYDGGGTTKFNSYQLPGGTDYRELLLTLPSKPVEEMQYPPNLRELPEGWHISTDRTQEPGRRFAVIPAGQAHGRPYEGQWPTAGAATRAALQRLNEERSLKYAEDWRERNEKRDFTGGHFPEKNVLAHIRFNTRTVDGKKVLFLEEVQSDWHQKGRKQGYQEPSTGPKPYTLDDISVMPGGALKGDDNNRGWRFKDERTGDVFMVWVRGDEPPPYDTALNNRNTIAGAQHGHATGQSNAGKVPDAPFKKTWHELALKRMLRYASEHGYDSLAFTTGAQQAERYDLSKQVKSIAYRKNGDGDFEIYVETNQGDKKPITPDVAPEKLADYVGKEVADKILSGEGEAVYDDEEEAEFKVLSGLDLKVGGEGMRGFYDKILPDFLNKYGKKWGATVDDLDLSGSKSRDDLTSSIYGEGVKYRNLAKELQRKIDEMYTTVHALPITEAMKASVMEEGQPLFQTKHGDPEAYEAQAVQAAIEGKSLTAAAQFLADSAPSDDYRLIAKRVVQQLERLTAAGMDFKLHVPHVGDRVPGHLIGSRGLTWKRHDSDTTHVYLQGADVTGYVGTSYETLLHELVHAVTMNAVYVGNKKKHAGRAVADSVNDLYDVTNAILRHFNQKIQTKGVDLALGDDSGLTDFERSVYKGGSNALQTADEVLAWALTNRKMQEYLDTVPYKGKDGPTLWQRFVQAIRTLLGLSPKADTALSEVLRIADELLDMPANELLALETESLPMTVNRPGEGLVANRRTETSRHLRGLTEDQTQALTRVHGEPETWAKALDRYKTDWKRRLSQGLVDQFSPILDYSKKAYILARMAMGGEGTLEALLMYGKPYVDDDGAYRVDYSKERGFNGFSKVLAALQGEHDRFLEWVAARRAENLKEVGLENLYSEEDIATLKTLNDGEMPDGSSRKVAYEKALMELNEWNAAMVKIALNSGLITEEYAETLKDLPYVPFYRLHEEGVTGFGSTPGLEKQYAWKRLKGGTAHLNDDLLANLLQNWSHIITASAKNRAAKETLEAAEEAGVAEEQPAGAPEGKHTVSFKDEGKVRVFTVTDPLLLDAVAAMHYAGLGAIAKPFTMMKRALTFGVTVNPAYKIRNLIRDSIQAIGTADLSYNPLKNIAAGAKATVKESETRAQMLAGGGMIRFGSMLDGNSAARTRDLIESGVPKEFILSDDNAVEKFWTRYLRPAFDAYQEFGDRGEQVNRAALYERLIAKDMSHLEASFWARDLMDFSLTGKWEAVRILTQVVPFMNARLQGLYKLGRAGKEDYKRMGATTGAVILASLALLVAYSDDDDWKRREDWDRDNYWWFKVAGHAVRIPKPFELGAIGTIAERLAEFWASDEMTGKRFMERVGATVMSQLSMNPTPQLFKPMIDLYANKDAFTQKPIETLGMERLRKADRYNDRTSEAARLLGKLGLPDPAKLAMGHYDTLSPVQIDALVHSYFSWVGAAATTALDYGIRPLVTRGEKPTTTLKDAFLVGNFVESLPTGSSRYVTQLYDQAKEIEEAYGSYRDALKRGDVEKAKSLIATEREKLKLYPLMEQVKRTEGEINTRIKQIESSDRLSGDEKREKIDRLKEQKHRLAQRLSQRVAPSPSAP